MRLEKTPEKPKPRLGWRVYGVGVIALALASLAWGNFDPGQPAPHRHVPHPRDLLAGPGGELRKANDWAAFRLAAIYGAAITIWLFALYTFTGAIFTAQQPTLLYWSNGAQLVFCPLMVYVGNRLGKGQQAKADADHEALGHIANTVDKILGSVGAGKDAAQ